MINYIQIKSHKALVHAEMMGLGNINVICGRNNSGKTTIVEALLDNNCYGIGKKLDNADWIVNIFKPQADAYNSPNPDLSLRWFSNYIKQLIQENTIWFSDNRNEIKTKIYQSMENDPYLHRFSRSNFNFDLVLNEFFKNSLDFYNPYLIPPIRQLEFQTNINLAQEISSEGSGIVNKLFFIKNQDLESEYYNVYKKIYDIFQEITGAKFNVVPDKNNQIKLFYNTNEKWIPASDSGLGLTDVLIMISIFNLVDRNVFLLEEPENHLHAAYQKQLLKYLKSLRSKEFFITTHSSIFLDISLVNKIFYCKNNGEISLSDQTSKSEIINSLGYSVTENLVADLIILVEGPTDIPVIREMLNWFGIDHTYNVKYWALGGDIMSYLDLSVFAERKNVYALVDSDPGSSTHRTRFIRNCAINGIKCKKLKRYSIENYFTIKAIRDIFLDQIPDEIQSISPSRPVDVQIGFKSRKKTIKIRNAEIVKQMNISDIEGTDLYEFLNDIKSFFEKNY